MESSVIELNSCSFSKCGVNFKRLGVEPISGSLCVLFSVMEVLKTV